MLLCLNSNSYELRLCQSQSQAETTSASHGKLLPVLSAHFGVIDILVSGHESQRGSEQCMQAFYFTFESLLLSHALNMPQIHGSHGLTVVLNPKHRSL